MAVDKKLVDYFIEKTDERFVIIESKLDTLLEFRWRVLGGAAAIAILCTFAVNLLVAYLQGK